MLRSFIGADMRLYERFGIGLHNNPDTQNFIVRNGVKSTFISMKGRNLRPIYDQNLRTRSEIESRYIWDSIFCSIVEVAQSVVRVFTPICATGYGRLWP